ncbi:4-(cytidine 5'-diphospho)-2-C-methyl-D-erythritol kinase [Roseovarius sp. EL26]|uniref:4-(cytidine 5'-diphospho)-2-C-methyl-D-erythritol kinase n=1 Tax=Roseovarius sp. EL26 TaxID=2126672 RepID=UPI000EA1A28D|nr:4-(cytidine 5'-diphospho)-2-C-methyl-D-erythritol kinase [Roseovarius sp. EL26]
MTQIEAFAPAKINLTLHVTDRRPDGYHMLDSLVVFADIGDRLTVESATQASLTVSGPMSEGVPTDDRNLVLRAAALIGVPAKIHLEKRLPHAAGIGGGSSDAAASLKVLAQLGNTPLPKDSAVLGADVPVCLVAKAARMRGIGNVIKSIANFPTLHAVMINPNVAIETKTIFPKLESTQNTAMPSVLPGFKNSSDCITFLRTTRNDLEAAAIQAQPVIQDVLSAIAQTAGCQIARMSGSGATCFGLYNDEAAAQRAVQSLQTAHQNWWIVATKLS